MVILEIKNLTKRFGGVLAVDHLSFDVKNGQILGLIGPNGAGKTTVFNLITGVFSSDSGEILFKGEHIKSLKPYEVCKKGICRTFQIVQPFREITVFQNVMIGAFCRTSDVNEAKEKTLRVLEFMGLYQKTGIIAKDLTLIEQLKLEFARALATDPELLLLDESMAGLNPVECKLTEYLIKKIRDEGITLVVVEHNIRAILSIVDYIIVVANGSKIYEGKPQEVVHDRKVIEAYLGEGFSNVAFK